MVKDLFLSSRKVLSINGEIISLGELRKRLLIKHEGESISYLTDFIFDSPSKKKAIKLIKNCGTVICESQYLTADVELAKKNYHLTVSQAAEIASKGNAGKLIIFHNSERYNIKDDYPNFLKEARAQFQNTFFPEEWV
jgi:ribonuclease BN (tRNA processing enzyme)